MAFIGVGILLPLVGAFKVFKMSSTLLIKEKLQIVQGPAIWLLGLNGLQKYLSYSYSFSKWVG